MVIFLDGFEVTKLPDGFHYVRVLRVGGKDDGEGVPVHTTRDDIKRSVVMHEGSSWYRTLDRNGNAIRRKPARGHQA